MSSLKHILSSALASSLVLLSLTPIADAQFADCFTIDGNTPCGPAFAGWPVARYLVQSYQNQAQFSAFVTDQWGATLSQSDSLGSYFGCSASSTVGVQTLRYQMTYWCSSIIYDALAHTNATTCKAPAGKTLASVTPCSDKCTMAADSLETFFNSPYCGTTTNATQNTARSARLTMIRGNCNGAFANALQALPGATCVNGAVGEGANCGFLNQGNAITQCKNIKNDACCTSLLAASSSSSTRAATNAPSSSPTDPTADAANDSQGSSGSNKTGVVVGVVLTILILAAIATAYFLIRRRRRSTMDKDSFGGAYAPYRNDYGYQNYGSGSDKDEDLSSRAVAVSRGVEGAGVGYGTTSETPNTYLSVTNPSTQQERTSDIPLGALAVASSAAAQQAQDGTQQPIAPARTPSQTVPMRIIHPYNPSLQDELTLVPGATLLLVKAFDDGWALGLQPETGKQGAFPLVCVAPFEGSPPTARDVEAERASLTFNKRVSSVVDFEGFEFGGAGTQPVPNVPEKYLSGGGMSNMTVVPVPGQESGDIGDQVLGRKRFSFEVDQDATLSRNPRVIPAGAPVAPPTDPFSGPFDDEHSIPTNPQPRVAAVATPVIVNSSSPNPTSPLHQAMDSASVTTPDWRDSTGTFDSVTGLEGVAVREGSMTESMKERERERILSLNLGEEEGKGLGLGFDVEGK
ncbi:hypothetical protein HDV00_000892 [Rhizophlyctis rosea]|nr:hypothetical protein HDV00_000892 [Rhizophlyctis rosea]